MGLLLDVDIDVRWRDLDAYNHVNNSVFLTLIEEARIRWFGSFQEAWRTPEAEPLVARTEVNYRAPITYPAKLRVQLFSGRIGRSSLALEHRIVDADSGVLYSDGVTVLVWFNPKAKASVEIPTQVRRAAEQATGN